MNTIAQSTTHSIVQCPVCQQPLHFSQTRWQCNNGHHFDLAKQGYCNLLLANQKKSATPGDDRQMLSARREFLQRGFYQPVADAMLELLAKQPEHWQQVVDVGCGEGYYLAQLQQQLTPSAPCFYGTDISRDALKLAARSYKDINWFVAAAKGLPFCTDSVDLILNIFAPADWQELHRIATPDGKVLLAVAGRRHLFGLKQHVYDTVNLHQPERILQQAAPWFELIAEKDCLFELTLENPRDVSHLLQMTPFFWQAGETRRRSIENLQSLTTPVNVQLYLMQARHLTKDKT